VRPGSEPEPEIESRRQTTSLDGHAAAVGTVQVDSGLALTDDTADADGVPELADDVDAQVVAVRVAGR